MSLGERLLNVINDNGGSIWLYDASVELGVTTKQVSTAASRLIAQGKLMRDASLSREHVICYFIPGTPGFERVEARGGD